jgi:hypothetical protein
LLPFSNSWIDYFFVCGKSDPASSLDLLAIFVESVTDDRLGAILIGGDRLGREGVVGGIIKLFLISPVRAAARMLEQCLRLLESRKLSKEEIGAIRGLTLQLWTSWRVIWWGH